MKARAREDQFIVGYLLGLSTEMEQGQIETRYFRDQRFYEQVLVIEEELICDYLSHDLTGEERQRFERHFLQSDHRRKKFQATRKLMAYIADQGLGAVGASHTVALAAKTAAHSTRPVGLLDYLGGLLMPKLKLGYMLAATALLLLCGFWLTSQIAGLRQTMRQTETERLALQRQELELRGAATRQRAEAAAKRDEAASLTELVASGANTLSASMERQTPQATPAVKLSLATVRSSATLAEINLPRAAQTVLVALSLEPSLPETARYLVKLRAAETVSPTWQWEATSQNHQLLLEIPTAGVNPGLYSLTVARIVSASPSNEFAGELFLRIVRK